MPSAAGLTATFEIDADPVYVPNAIARLRGDLEPGLFTCDSLKIKLDDYGALSGRGDLGAACLLNS